MGVAGLKARNKNITWYIAATTTTTITRLFAVVWKVAEENSTFGYTEKFVIRALQHVWNKFLLRFSVFSGRGLWLYGTLQLVINDL